MVFDLNGHGLAMYHSDASFRNLMDQADVIHADGGFLISASKKLSAKQIAERSATTDMIHDLAAACSKAGLSFYLLGATASVNEGCVAELRRIYPDLEIAGARDGFFSQAEQDEVLEEIAATKPDIVWVGMGKPREQAFAIAAREKLQAGWIITCGGCFNYITGAYPRAPQWMQDNNLEWVHRLVTNPRALFWRYLWTTPYALWLTLRHSSKGVRNG
ncbi:MAG: WecB/TagA/CpsF family glycosyltransferase [Maritimibacter sp.]